MQRRIGAAVLAAAAITMTFTGSAQAETNPSCPSGVTQIGATKYLKSGSTTIASVKQFKGCDKNWGYVYVWDSWRANHRTYRLYAGVQVRGAEFPSGYNSVENKQELWSYGTDTLDKCTKGYGSIVASSYSDGAETEERC
ncbi:hypothetical protein SK803_14760 [Lentzea sp. BCCO 10_0856]|uniref:Secreted protein n=1 Tax=Lentzea miocenica TaxID=3095431 RepID=A0ABU4T010_9PSEU|nr:hypothetical protein [Lentzea sp. BCCO 10_0856]MDX8031484.1 hypothetical protein [Lentzea sp. BCCO 10_0856]